jgi:hypothetical protein
MRGDTHVLHESRTKRSPQHGGRPDSARGIGTSFREAAQSLEQRSNNAWLINTTLK